ncbi:MAG TPA: FAD:protein FMN transferase, partial [Longimicrobiaceae bacterium]|nr:FAD:protein FMN transferase [Longimicrobiaceae bacterium]
VQARIVLYAPHEQLATRAAKAAFDRISMLDSIMSDYRPDSELMQLSARAGGPPVPVSRELFQVLSHAQELAHLSRGAFDVTMGPVVRLWRTARRTGALPTLAEREQALARVGWRHLRLDPAAQTVQLLVPGMQLDLGGIAKGYAADEAISTLRAHRVERALVELGGDIVVSGPPPGEEGWQVSVANAEGAAHSLLLAHAALSTSGDTEQFVEIGGQRYSHVVDPATGLGLGTRIAATVIAPDGITADALSTLLSVLGPERGQAFLAAHFPAANAYIRRVELSILLESGSVRPLSGSRSSSPLPAWRCCAADYWGRRRHGAALTPGPNALRSRHRVRGASREGSRRSRR